MRRTLSLLILALLVGACGDDDGGPRLATIDELRVVKVSGDQSSPVPDAAPSATIYATADASLQSSPGSSWTSEPLVARVEVVQSRGAGMSGPSGAAVPSGTMVHWQLPDEAGRLFGGTTATDDSAHVVNRWAPGTRAGTYTAQAGRLVGTEIVIDAEWELVVEPGAVANLQWHGPAWLCTGDEVNLLDLVSRARDAHNNDIDLGTLGEDLGAALAWKWLDRVQNSDAVGPEGSGLEVIVPDLSEYNFWPLTQIGYFGDPDRTYYAGGLRVWLNGHDTGYALAAQVFAKGHCPR